MSFVQAGELEGGCPLVGPSADKIEKPAGQRQCSVVQIRFSCSLALYRPCDCTFGSEEERPASECGPYNIWHGAGPLRNSWVRLQNRTCVCPSSQTRRTARLRRRALQPSNYRVWGGESGAERSRGPFDGCILAAARLRRRPLQPLLRRTAGRSLFPRWPPIGGIPTRRHFHAGE